MYIRSIKLRDWKAYESATFEFPAPGNRKNVVLIGGENGFGKTTLFEALALGLFGRDGLPLVLRAGVAGDEQKLSQNFRSFIERALFSGALPAGRSSCSIELKFFDGNDEPIEIVRKWHFNDAGRLKQGDYGEELRILEGTGRRPVNPPRSEADPEAWFRDWISRKFLPTSLASFFLFDGESASIYAERDMGAQVRAGIAGLLGLNWLEQLAKDLRAYAAQKRSQLPREASTEAISQLDSMISAMEAELEQAGSKLQEIEAELRGSELERDSLTRELTANHGGGTRAQFEELAKDKADFERQYASAEDRLRTIAEMDLPLALAGQPLRQRVEIRLEQERKREQWEAATSQRQERTSQVDALLGEQLAEVAPPLTVDQEHAVRLAVQHALERLWFPPPADVADSFRHPHARGPLLQRVLDRLANAQAVSTETGLSRVPCG
ncbi:MAG: AAA family ATPase [Rhodanobacteraceae bacterium]|jgi:DNA sulfur modification protein DndD|nr:AAA family ATPase [Rhodanobacteraceae bacterium]